MLQAAEEAILSTLTEFVTKACRIRCPGDNQSTNIEAWPPAAVFISLDMASSIPALVHGIMTDLSQADATPSDDPSVVRRCQEHLVSLLTEDGMLRLSASELDPYQIQLCQSLYKEQRHNSLAEYLSVHCQNSDQDCKRFVILTFSPIFSLQPLLPGMPLSLDKLGGFTAEAQLLQRIEQFFSESATKLYVIQVDDLEDADHVQLARARLDEARVEYVKSGAPLGPKHVCLVIHVDRRANDGASWWSFNPLSRWQHVLIDSLSSDALARVDAMQGKAVYEVVGSLYQPLIRNSFMWCFSQIHFPSENGGRVDDFVLHHVRRVIDLVNARSELCDLFYPAVLAWVERHGGKEIDWILRVACNRQLLFEHFCLADALMGFVLVKVREGLVRLIYGLEQLEVLDTYLTACENGDRLQLWTKLFQNNNIFAAPALDKESQFHVGVMRALIFPFSKVFHERICKFFDNFMQQRHQLKRNFNEACHFTQQIIFREIPELEVFRSDFAIHCMPFQKDVVQLEQFHQFLAIEDCVKVIGWLLCGTHTEDVHPALLFHFQLWDNHNDILYSLELFKFALSDGCDVSVSDLLNQLEDRFGNCGDDVADRKSALVALMCIRWIGVSIPLLMHGQLTAEFWAQSTHQLLCKIAPLRVKDGNALFLLRLCESWARLVVVPANLPNQSLVAVLQALAPYFTRVDTEENSWNALDSEECLEDLTRVSKSQVENNDAVMPRFAVFMKDVLGRVVVGPCVRACRAISQLFAVVDPSDPGLRKVLAKFIERDFEEMAFVDLVLGAEANSFVQHLAEVLSSLPAEHLFPVLLVDVLHEHFADCFLHIQENEDDDRSESEEEYAMSVEDSEGLLDACHTVLRDPVESTDGPTLLKRLTACGAIKASLDTLFTEDLVNSLTLANINQECLNCINALLADDTPMATVCRTYSLKRMRSFGLSVGEVKLCCERLVDTFSWMLELTWMDSTPDPLPFNPFRPLPHYSTADELWTLVLSDVDVSDRLRKFLAQGPQAAAGLEAMLAWRVALLREGDALPDRIHVLLPQWQALLQSISASPVISLLGATLNKSLGCSTFGTDSQGEERVLFMSVLLHVISRAMSDPISSPFGRYLLDPGLLTTEFLPTMPSNEERDLLMALGERVTRFECQCGFRYLVGECGAPMQAGSCPKCRRPIGGQSHRPHAAQQRLDNAPENDLPGYISELEEKLPGVPVRSLTRFSCLVLDLFLHATLTAGALLHQDRLAVTMKVPAARLQGLCLERCLQSWRALKALLHMADESVAAVVHACVTECFSEWQQTHIPALATAAARHRFESRANNVLVQIAGASHSSAQRYIAALINLVDADRAVAASLENMIDERPGPWQDHDLVRFFRIVGVKSETMAKAVFELTPTSRDEYPLLFLLFKHEPRLKYMKHLAPLVAFANMVLQNYNHRFRREDLKTHTLDQFAKLHGEATEKALDEFLSAWEAVRLSGLVTHLLESRDNRVTPTCTEITMVSLTPESPLAVACLEPTDTGGILYSAILAVADIQNKFLEEVLAAVTNTSHCAALHDYRVSGSMAYMPGKRLQDLQPSQLITFQWHNSLLDFGHNALGLGYGQRINFAWVDMEMAAAVTFVHRRPFLDLIDITPFVYAEELFHSDTAAFDKLCEKIPQESIPDHVLSSLITSVRQRAAEILATIPVVVFQLNLTTGQPSMSLSSYIHAWLPTQLTEPARNAIKAVGDVTLSQLLSLYKGLESELAPGAVAALPDEYCTSLPKKLRFALLDAVGASPAATSEPATLPLVGTLSAVERFIFRYLSARHGERIPPSAQLHLYLQDERLWPSNALSPWPDDFSKVFPSEIQLAHLHHVATLLGEVRLLAPRLVVLSIELNLVSRLLTSCSMWKKISEKLLKNYGSAMQCRSRQPGQPLPQHPLEYFARAVARAALIKILFFKYRLGLPCNYLFVPMILMLGFGYHFRPQKNYVLST